MRDMTRKQFHAAIKRHGWRQELLWITGTDKEGRTHGIGLVMRNYGKGFKVSYRASLAEALRTLESRA
jgi:ATP:corrinoid adenosyltransferase